MCLGLDWRKAKMECLLWRLESYVTAMTEIRFEHRENSREIVLVNEWWRGSKLVLGERDLWKLIRQAFDDEWFEAIYARTRKAATDPHGPE